MLSFYFVLAMVVMTTAITTDEGPRTYCGRMLASAQSLYCDSLEDTPQKKYLKYPSIESGKDMWDWLAKRFSYAMSSAARSKRIAGLVKECCHKPCYVSQLLSYC
ncbi:bombyxin A-3 homolog [Epargyreus clarus]|uniref:bombyxin A-3 homolog n=1 Tax=Epargyreus clarus TaxID=520877 RepID=UPI003C2D202B